MINNKSLLNAFVMSWQYTIVGSAEEIPKNNKINNN